MATHVCTYCTSITMTLMNFSTVFFHIQFVIWRVPVCMYFLIHWLCHSISLESSMTKLRGTTTSIHSQNMSAMATSYLLYLLIHVEIDFKNEYTVKLAEKLFSAWVQTLFVADFSCRFDAWLHIFWIHKRVFHIALIKIKDVVLFIFPVFEAHLLKGALKLGCFHYCFGYPHQI